MIATDTATNAMMNDESDTQARLLLASSSSFVENHACEQMKRNTSCFFSVKSCLSDEDAYEKKIDVDFDNDEEVDDDMCEFVSDDEKGHEYQHQVDVIDELYHEVMFTIFSYMSANDLVNFSAAARRPNVDCFYYLQLKIEDALHFGMAFYDVHKEDERLWCCQHFDSGAGAIVRLTAMDKDRAEKIAQIYRDSNLPHGISLSLRAQLAAAAAQRHKGTTMMLTALGASAMMGNESAQALLSMGMCAQLVRSGMENVKKVDFKDAFQKRMNSYYIPMPHLPLPESCMQSVFPSVIASRMQQFALDHGLVAKNDVTVQSSVESTRCEFIEDKCPDEKRNSEFEDETVHDDSVRKESKEHQTVPSGCVGAYTRVVRESALAIREICKEKRKERFNSLDIDFRRHLCAVFIDACTSDENYATVVSLVRDQGVDPDGFYVNVDNVETCGLHLAASSGAIKVLDFLCKGVDENDAQLDGGFCDINILDDNGWSALHFAAGSNNVDAVRILATYGAELTIEAHNGYTPFHWAERLSNKEVGEELKRHKADKKFSFMIRTVQPIQQFTDRFFAFTHH